MRMRIGLLIAAVALALAAPVHAAERVLTLEEAVKTAKEKQPQLRASKAQVEAAGKRVGQASSTYLPRVDATAQYQRSTANLILTPSLIKLLAGRGLPGNTLDTSNLYNFGVTAQELIYDFGKTGGAVESAEAQERSSRADLATVERSTLLNVRVAYFNVLAAKELVVIGDQTAANQTKHVRQIKEFVSAGTRPKIDLTSAELNLANVELTTVRAQNALSLSKVQLNSAMGIEGPLDFDVVAPAQAATVPEGNGPSDSSIDQILQQALTRRPELARLEAQVALIEGQKRAASSGYYPALLAQTSIVGGSVDSNPVGVNWAIGVALNWNLFGGMLTTRQVEEAEANLQAVTAQRDALRISIRSELEQQLLSVEEAKSRLAVAERAVSAAGERLLLAEGRYQAGAGDILELDDAQVTDANAKAQRVQAQYDLAIARTRLAYAAGEE